MLTNRLTHFNDDGLPQMVDVGGKEMTERTATARAYIRMEPSTRTAILEHRIQKGDVLAVAQLAGIMAAKKTPDWIPLCHPIPITKVDVALRFVPDAEPAMLEILATVKTVYRTGVEMEALTACSAAGLTVYDMCKAIDRSMSIESIALVHKAGGKSGTYERAEG